MESEKVNTICFTVLLCVGIISIAIASVFIPRTTKQDNETKSKIDAIHKVIVGS